MKLNKIRSCALCPKQERDPFSSSKNNFSPRSFFLIVFSFFIHCAAAPLVPSLESSPQTVSCLLCSSSPSLNSNVAPQLDIILVLASLPPVLLEQLLMQLPPGVHLPLPLPQPPSLWHHYPFPLCLPISLPAAPPPPPPPPPQQQQLACSTA